MALTATTTDANKALVRQAIGYNHGTAEDPTAIFSPDFVAYMPGQPPMDRATFEQYVGGVTDGIPGYTYLRRPCRRPGYRPVDRVARDQHV